MFEQGSDANQFLVLVLHGALKLSMDAFNADDADVADADAPWCAYVQPKELVGGMQLLTNEPSLFTVKAALFTIVARISKAHFDDLVVLKPCVLLPVAHSIILRYSSFVRSVDFAFDWILLDSGRSAYRYFVIVVLDFLSVNRLIVDKATWTNQCLWCCREDFVRWPTRWSSRSLDVATCSA